MSHSERVQTDDLVRDADEPLAREGSPDEPLAREGSPDEPPAREGSPLEALFDDDRAGELRRRWQELQSGFVDDPRDTVQEADALVAELLQELARTFSDARSRLEQQWTQGENVSTEDLRLTLQRYRSFFERLLSV